MARTKAAGHRESAGPWQMVGFYGVPGLEYGTTDGGWLRFTSDQRVSGALALRNETRLCEQVPNGDDDEVGIGTDILAAELRVADADGRLWAATAFFDAGLLVSQLIDLSRLNCTPYRETTATRWQAARDAGRPNSALSDVRFWSDDRFIRTFAISVEEGREVVTRVVELQFKYTLLSFDVDYHRPHEDCDELQHMLDLRVRLNDGCAFDYHSVEDIGPLVFTFSWEVVFQHNRWTWDDGGRWRHATLPIPLVFRPIEGQGTPQAHVEVSSGGPGD